MDARIQRRAIACIIFFLFGSSLSAQQLFQVASRNFVIRAPDENLARKASQLAEKYRAELSSQWLGYEIPAWNEKCPVTIHLAALAGGETSFAFAPSQERGQPFGWQMTIYGPPDRILDAVLPHEITHTIFATHFGRPLPRWADEGACTTVEHESERAKNHKLLLEFLTSKPSRGIPFNRMFTMKQYPHDILPLYAQGYSLARYLIAQKGKQHFVNYVQTGMTLADRGNELSGWNKATEQCYGIKDLSELQVTWQKWVERGSLLSDATTEIVSASADSPAVVALEPPLIAMQLANNDNGVVQGSWYRQQMSAANVLPIETPVDAVGLGASSAAQLAAPLNDRNTYLPGSLQNSSREILLRRVVFPPMQ